MSFLLTTIAAATAIQAGGAPSEADAASRRCPSQPSTLAKDGDARVWHRGASLYGCERGPRSPVIRRLGPWKPGTKVKLAFGGEVAWTVPLVRDGVRSDRIWRSGIRGGMRTLAGALAVPARDGLPEREGRVQRLVAISDAVAWTTTSGEVGFVLPSADDEPSAIGPLPDVPKPTGDRLLVGSFPDADPAVLAASLTLDAVPEDGEGDDCGGVVPWDLTVTPDGTTPVGVRWFRWFSRDC